MFTNEIENYLKKLFANDNDDKSRELTPEYFSEILNNGIATLFANKDEFLKANFIQEKSAPWLNELIIHLNFESSDHKELISDFFYTAIIILSFIAVMKKEDAKKYFTASSEIELFRSDSNHRIINLKNQLAEKHPTLSKIINEKFDTLLKDLETDFTAISAYLSPLAKMEYDGENIPDTLFPKNEGRPSDMMIELILISIYEIAQKISPNKHYAKVIMPTMAFLSAKFPNILDSNDYNNYDSLRNRIKYIVGKHKSLENSQSTGE